MQRRIALLRRVRHRHTACPFIDLRCCARVVRFSAQRGADHGRGCSRAASRKSDLGASYGQSVVPNSTTNHCLLFHLRQCRWVTPKNHNDNNVMRSEGRQRRFDRSPVPSATCPRESVLPIRLRPDFSVVFGGYAGWAEHRPGLQDGQKASLTADILRS